MSEGSHEVRPSHNRGIYIYNTVDTHAGDHDAVSDDFLITILGLISERIYSRHIFSPAVTKQANTNTALGGSIRIV